MDKIISFEQQGLAKSIGQGIGKAIPKVQPGWVAAFPAEVAVSFPCDLRLLFCNRFITP
jgi:hypothetical protein